MEQGRERSYRKASERRAEILSRAIELFAERGVGASLRAIGDAIETVARAETEASGGWHFPSTPNRWTWHWTSRWRARRRCG